MSEREGGATHDGALDARVDAALRTMVAEDGPADMRARVMARLAVGRDSHVARGPGGRWVVRSAAALVVVVVSAAIMLRPGHVERAGPRDAVRATATAPPSTATPVTSPTLPVEPAPASVPAVHAPNGGALGRRVRNAGVGEWPEEGTLPALEVPPIEGTDPLVLPPVRAVIVAEPEIAILPIEIATLPAESASSGSF